MIQSVYLVTAAGETMAVLEFSGFHADEALFGGFVSAVESFSKKMSGSSIQELLMGEHRLVVSPSGNLFVVTIHSKDDPNPAALNRKVVEIVSKHGDTVSDELLGSIKESVTKATSVRGCAGEWASKMF